mgnify:CR=1 FL=1
MPHRSPGAPGGSRPHHLSGKPIKYYRPKGSAEVRRLIEVTAAALDAGIAAAVPGATVEDVSGADAVRRDLHE